MAAELMYLKSKSLLPLNKKEDDTEDDEEITREKLINKLLEYKKYKEMTPIFKELEEERKKIYIKAPEKVSNYVEHNLHGEESIDNLVEAFKKFLNRKDLEKPLETTITKREYSVRKRKDDIKNILKIKKKVYLEDLFEEYNKPFVVVTFLSILEMVKEKEIAIKQNKNFDNILIELRN